MGDATAFFGQKGRFGYIEGRRAREIHALGVSFIMLGDGERNNLLRIYAAGTMRTS